MSSHNVIACMLTEDALASLRSQYSVSLRPLREPIAEDKLSQAHAIVTTPYDRVNSEFLHRASKLKIIAQFGVGIDNIDLGVAKTHGVAVTHTPGVAASATAELTIALILSVTRRLKEADHILGQGPEAMPLGLDLVGKNLGIIGMGQIGAAVARRAHAFGMKIYYANRRRVNPTIERETTASRRSLQELFEISDVLALHCDLNSDSHHLINRQTLARMKDSAIIVNMARASVIDEGALAEALTSGKLWGAGLDVFSADLPGDIRHHPRVVLTPHSGTATIGTRVGMSNMVVDSITACLSEDDKIPYRRI